MTEIRLYFVTFLMRSSAMPYEKCLIYTNFISFSVKNKKSRWVHCQRGWL